MYHGQNLKAKAATLKAKAATLKAKAEDIVPGAKSFNDKVRTETKICSTSDSLTG